MKLFTNDCCQGLLNNISLSKTGSYSFVDQFKSTEIQYLKHELSIPEPAEIVLIPAADADCKNSIAIFEHFKNLTPVQANDRRLWVTLTHTTFFDYCKQRWKIDAETTERTIIERFHFEGAGLATRVRNTISRLWWSAFITYENSRKDPYELTRLLWSKQDIYMGLVERSFGTYESVVKGFLEFYSTHRFLNEEQIRRLFTALNAMGGVKPLAVHSQSEIKEFLSRSVDYFEFNKDGKSKVRQQF
jgi:hypothetical protein